MFSILAAVRGWGGNVNQRKAFMRARYLLSVTAASISALSIAAPGLLVTPARASSVLPAVPGIPGAPARAASLSLRSAAIKNIGFAGYRRKGGGTSASFSATASFVVPRL